MRAILFSSSLTDGGAERVMVNLASYLASKGHDVEILSMTKRVTYRPADNVKLSFLSPGFCERLPYKIVLPFQRWRFKRYLKRHNPGVYISFLPTQSIWLLDNKQATGAPVIVAERACPERYDHGLKERILETYRKADGYQFQTQEAKAFYEAHGYDLSHSIVLPNAINPEFIRPPYTGPRRKVIVGVGRLDWQKNFLMLLESFAQIHHNHPDYSIEIYGRGYQEQRLKDRAAELGIADKVKLCGYVKDIIPAIVDASLFVLSSNYEGMPNALAEAMSLGLPCISTDCEVGGPRVLIKDGVNGLLVPTGDMAGLAKAIDRMLSDNDMAWRLAEKAREVATDLAPDKIYGKWEEFILDIVNTYAGHGKKH